jgi:small-conductance mechanosensitive channel
MDKFFAWALIILSLMMGLLQMVKPYSWWSIETFLTLKEGEPSDFYLLITRIRGFLWIIISLVCVWLLYQ